MSANNLRRLTSSVVRPIRRKSLTQALIRVKHMGLLVMLMG